MAWDKLNKESHQYLQPNLLVVQRLVANLFPKKPTFDFICVNFLILIYSVPDWCSTALEDYSTALQDCNEMDSCWEEEKRKSQNEMETISGKRNDRGWRDLEPDSTVVI